MRYVAVCEDIIFQSTLPREERHIYIRLKRCNAYFNPRSHERSDILYFNSLCRCILFQSTLPREERLRVVTSQAHQFTFQSTLPREERLILTPRFHHPVDFNPRSHERSDTCDDVTALISDKISIHAPTRGATKAQKYLKRYYIISIHAPTRGATAILHKKFVYFYTIPTINI